MSRNLERVADLATNIGEDAVFLAEGKSIKHHAEDRGEARATGSRRRSRARDRPAGTRARRRAPGTTRDRIAAIDVGSNSVRLLVAEYDAASRPHHHRRDEGPAPARGGAGRRPAAWTRRPSSARSRRWRACARSASAAA